MLTHTMNRINRYIPQSFTLTTTKPYNPNHQIRLEPLFSIAVKQTDVTDIIERAPCEKNMKEDAEASENLEMEVFKVVVEEVKLVNRFITNIFRGNGDNTMFQIY